jgi:hypothetical protein
MRTIVKGTWRINTYSQFCPWQPVQPSVYHPSKLLEHWGVFNSVFPQPLAFITTPVIPNSAAFAIMLLTYASWLPPTSPCSCGHKRYEHQLIDSIWLPGLVQNLLKHTTINVFFPFSDGWFQSNATSPPCSSTLIYSLVYEISGFALLYVWSFRQNKNLQKNEVSFFLRKHTIRTASG